MEKVEFIYATYIRTTPEKLWEALTNGDFSVKYWFGFRFEVELKAGGNVRILPPPGMEEHGDHAGKVLVCEPYRKLVYTWNQKDLIPEMECYDDCKPGWDFYLNESLAKLLNEGRGLPYKN